MSEAANDHLERAKAGDRDAIAALLARSGPEVRERLDIGAPFRSLLDADDIMQVTYLEAFLHIADFRGENEESFRAWLARMAANNLKDAIRELERAKRPSPRRRAQPASDESYIGLLDAVGTSSKTPSRAAAAKEARGLLDDAICRLPESYRRVVRLYDLEGLDAEQVGDRLGRSAGAVFMLRARALDRLRHLLGGSSSF